MKMLKRMLPASCVLVGLVALGVYPQDNSHAQVPPGGKIKAKVKDAPGPAPVVEAGDLMRLFNKPLYTYLKEAMAREPGNDDAWLTIEERGLQAAEVANLVAMRRAKPPQDQWLEGAFNLQQAGLTLAKAAKAKDWEATKGAYVSLIEQCNNCHKARAPDKAPMLRP